MSAQRPITPGDIAHYPRPGMNAPAGVQFSADGRVVTYLYSSEGTLTRELWAYDREAGREWRLLDPAGGGDSDATVSREEALRRERQRQLGSGVTAYAWSREGDTLLVPLGGEIYVGRADGTPLRRVGDGAGCIDPRLNPAGTHVAYVRNGDLYALSLYEGATPVRLTDDASPADQYGDRAVTNGLAEFAAQEEMGRSAGFWWSPDGEWLAFERVDASDVPLYLIPHPSAAGVDVEAHRYPFAGQANVRVRLGVVHRDGGPVRWLSLGDEGEYLARVAWTPDGCVIAQLQSRDQRRLALTRLDPDLGGATTLWVEENPTWVNLTDDLRFVRREDDPLDQYRILWSSERSGRRELYLYERDGGKPRQLSHGEIWIDGVRAVDPDGGWVYVDGWAVSPLERDLYRLPLGEGPPERLTSGGTHFAVISPAFDGYVDSHDAADSPPSVTLRRMDGSEEHRFQAEAAPDERIEALALRPPRFVSIAADDGEALHGALYLPERLEPGRRYPVVVSVYGGPHAQTVVDGWVETADLRAQYLAQEGFIVFKLDNRGMARRGLAFEGMIKENMGDLEVRDQVAGVRWLQTLPEVDGERIGVYGWSYGGYMALMCLARAPEVFKVAVAGAPVTDWDGYDTHYTERYMGTPESNPEGYRAGSVMAHVGQIRGSLLLVHGMIDENVHFRHTGRLITALISAGIDHDLMLFPEERHSPRREQDRAYMERRIAAFFKRTLAVD